MKRFLIGVSWTVVLQAGCAALLIAGWLVLDPLWIAENFLQPLLLTQTANEDYINGLKAMLIAAGAAIFAVNAVGCIAWQLKAAWSRIDGPGQAARLRWTGWLLFFSLGLILSWGAAYYFLQYNNTLVREDALLELYAIGTVMFIVLYFICTLFPTAPKFRPAVPLGTWISALPGYS